MSRLEDLLTLGIEETHQALDFNSLSVSWFTVEVSLEAENLSSFFGDVPVDFDYILSEVQSLARLMKMSTDIQFELCHWTTDLLVDVDKEILKFRQEQGLLLGFYDDTRLLSKHGYSKFLKVEGPTGILCIG